MLIHCLSQEIIMYAAIHNVLKIDIFRFFFLIKIKAQKENVIFFFKSRFPSMMEKQNSQQLERREFQVFRRVEQPVQSLHVPPSPILSQPPPLSTSCTSLIHLLHLRSHRGSWEVQSFVGAGSSGSTEEGVLWSHSNGGRVVLSKSAAIDHTVADLHSCRDLQNNQRAVSI